MDVHAIHLILARNTTLGVRGERRDLIAPRRLSPP
jgi:hypothetical protein